MMIEIFLISATLHYAAACSRQFISDISHNLDYCDSEECINAARRYNSSINKLIHPCDDFYEFVCSGWLKQNKLPPKKNRWTHYDAQYFHVLGQLHQSLEYLHRPKGRIERKVLNLYKGCMNEIKRESLRVKPLRQILKRIGGWPLIGDEFDRDNYDWLGTLALMSKNIGVSDVIFEVQVGPDPRNSTKNALYLHIAESERKVDSYDEDNIFHSEIFKLVSSMCSTIGTQELKEIKEVIKFEKTLEGFTKYRTSTLLKVPFVISNISNLQDAFGNKIDITSYMQKILEGIIQVTNETEIITPPRPAIRLLSLLIEKSTNRVMANFIGWKVAEKLSSLTISEFRLNNLQIVKASVGSEKDMPLHEHCIKITDSLLKSALASIYIKDHFSDEYVEDLHKLVKLMKSSFHDIIQESEWMDAETRQKAVLKLESMLSVIGYPKWIVDDRILNKYYETLGEVSEDDFFQSSLNILRFKRNKQLMTLTVPYDKYRNWLRSPIEVNAFYAQEVNGLYLPAAITQWPFYQYGLPQYINLGAIGSIIGHEMIHGFDNQGYMYDERGNVRNWWTPEVEDKFKNKSECFVQQYGKYKATKTYYVNGGQTLGENIADNGGLREAYKAWKKYEKQQGDYHDKRLPALFFTKDQLFFIAYTYIWCWNQNELATLLQLLVDEHAPTKFRVLGVLSNNRDFHNAFNCTKGDRMYSEGPCIVW